MSTYCTKADIEGYYGSQAVKQWADLDNTGVQSDIDARIAAAITTSSEEVNDRMRQGPYAVPFSDDPDTPGTIRRICVWLAGYDLYNPRGGQDFNEQGESVHRLSGDRNRAMRLMREIHAGVVELDFDTVVQQQAPEVVHVETTRDESATYDGSDEMNNWS